MATPTTLQSFYAGMRRDSPRDLLPNGALWNCVDYVSQTLGAPLRKRGSWTYASPDFGSDPIDGMCRTPAYGAGEFNVKVDTAGAVHRFTDAASTSLGTAFAVAQNPIVHRVDADTWLVIILAADGATAPKSWDGTTFGTLAGTPPAAAYGDVWNDYAVLANGTVSGVRYAGRAWWGPLGASASTWNTTDSWVDFSDPVIGVAGMRTGVMFFHANSVDRIKGTRPPAGTDEGDLVPDHPFEVGCADARSIVKYGETVIWAHHSGVYQSDGIALKNLTSAGGMSSYWFDQLLNLTSPYTIAATVVHDNYIVSLMNGSTIVDTLAYDLLHGFWWRISNMPGRCFMRVTGSLGEKVYMGLGNDGRVASLYLLFHPDSEVDSDANGTAVLPVLETGYYRGVENRQPSMALQQWKNMYANYDLRGGSPILTVSYMTDPGDDTYTAMAPTLAETTKYARVKRDLGFQSSGVAFKIAQTGGSTDTRIHALEAEFEPLEPSRLAQ